MPLVSVVIPAYNCINFINTSLISVYQQTYKNWEIFVIDDGSVDSTKTALGFQMNKIRYFHQENRGTAAAQNAGVERHGASLLLFWTEKTTRSDQMMTHGCFVVEKAQCMCWEKTRISCLSN